MRWPFISWPRRSSGGTPSCDGANAPVWHVAQVSGVPLGIVEESQCTRAGHDVSPVIDIERYRGDACGGQMAHHPVGQYAHQRCYVRIVSDQIDALPVGIERPEYLQHGPGSLHVEGFPDFNACRIVTDSSGNQLRRLRGA